jgi:hypothetical protein
MSYWSPDGPRRGKGKLSVAPALQAHLTGKDDI